MLQRLSIFLCAILLCYANAFAQTYDFEEGYTNDLEVGNLDCCEERPWDCCGFTIATSLGIGGGYRQDNLKWDFPGFSPGTAIHKKWKDLSIGMIEVNARALACERFLLKIDFDYGWFDDQKKNHVKIIDYNSAESIEHHFKTKGHVYDISGGIGYQFNWCWAPSLTFTPLVGWSYYHQTFKTPPFYAHQSGRFKTKHFTSEYYWNGPWAGFETMYRWNCNWLFYLSYEFHGAYFHANMKDFFHHQAKNMKSLGNEVVLGVGYQFCDCWLIGLKFDYKNFWTTRRHSTYDAYDGDNHAKRVEWDSYFVTLDVGLSF